MKGVSTIIATILLLLIAIALAGAVYLYSSGILSGRTSKTISVSDMYCSESRIVTFVLSNDGTVSIKPEDIKFVVDGTTSSLYGFTGDLEPHKTVVITGSGPEPAGQHTFLIVSPSNSVRQTVTC